MAQLHAHTLSSGMFRSGAPPALTAKSRGARLSAVRKNVVVSNAVRVGDKAPDFALKDQVCTTSSLTSDALQ